MNQNHIFSISHSHNDLEQEMYFCIKGKQEFFDNLGYPRLSNPDNEDVIAKAIQNKKPKHFNDKNKFYRYYIKMGPNLELFNPIELHSTIKEKSSKFSHINTICKNNWNFKEVDRSVFDQYINFLKSPHPKTLKDIQRQLS